MTVEISEESLLDLLEECLPALVFCLGGYPTEETIAKIDLILELAGRAPRLRES